MKVISGTVLALVVTLKKSLIYKTGKRPKKGKKRRKKEEIKPMQKLIKAKQEKRETAAAPTTKFPLPVCIYYIVLW